VVEPVVAVMNRRGAGLLLSTVLLLAFVAAPSAAGGHHHHHAKAVHKPPYKKGPSGGDEFNYTESDPKSGQVSVLRVFPGVPPVVGCTPEPSAGWVMLRVPHHVDGRIHKVTVNYDAQLDPYAWVTAGVRDARGQWLGVEKFQGPHSGAGKLVVHLDRQPAARSEVTVEFGLQLGDACPQVGGASASFPSIVIE
jgi:hypothetical protein